MNPDRAWQDSYMVVREDIESMGTDPMTIAQGTRVQIELIAQNKTREKLEFVLVPDEAADFDKGLLGMGTPLARTILGHTAGETLDYKRGDIVQVRLLSVRENVQALAPDTAEQREESLRRARDKAQHANMVSFALTFDSKWGDYDPENIRENWDVPGDKPAEPAPEPNPKKEE